MTRKKVLIICLLIFTSTFALQTATYFLFGLPQLIDKIAPINVAYLDLTADSVFAIGGAPSSDDCLVYKDHEIYPFDVKSKENELKKTYGAKYIYFHDYNSKKLNVDTNYSNYRLRYTAYARKYDWRKLSNLYKCSVYEELITRGGDLYVNREAEYRWILFFWFKCFEYRSVENKSN